MILARGLAVCALFGAVLTLGPAMADDIDNLLGKLSGPASEAAEAAAKKAPSPAPPQPGTDAPAPKATSAPVVPPAPVPATRFPSAAVAATPATTTPVDTKPVDTKSEARPPVPAAAEAKPKKPPLPAKHLFAAARTAAPLAVRSIGWYAKGCLAGAKPLNVDGPAWQVMRLSRNRYWGHPDMIALVERLATESKAAKEWPGLLVGDISQPRGGPMLTGHASHQVGLDADVWLTPMPDRTLTRREREDISATSMLAADDVSVDPKVFGDGQIKLIKRAASYAKVERILVHPAIKKALCEAGGTDRTWLSKVRPYFGHYYHFHIRIGCPGGSGHCTAQPPVPGDDGCGAELKDWLKKVAPKPPVKEAKPAPKPQKPAPKKPEIMLSDLPAECRDVLTAGGNTPPAEAVMVDNSKDAGPAKSEEQAAPAIAAQGAPQQN